MLPVDKILGLAKAIRLRTERKESSVSYSVYTSVYLFMFIRTERICVQGSF